MWCLKIGGVVVRRCETGVDGLALEEACTGALLEESILLLICIAASVFWPVVNGSV
jgi:hypothetical protein